MFNNKKISALLCFGAWMPLLCSCGAGILSDAGTDLSLQRDITDYLDISVLDNGQMEDSGEDTYTITRGTFLRPGLESTYNRDYYTAYPIRANAEYGTMTYVSTEVHNNEAVTKGAVLALVETEIDPLDLQESRLRLQRLTERYEEEKKNFEQEYEKRKEDIRPIWDKYEYESQIALLERWVLEWQNTCRNYEKQIAGQQKTVTQMEAYSGGAVSAITADRDGLVILPSSMPGNGDIVENGRLICSIIPLDELIISASNNDYQTFRYGMDFTWSVNLKGSDPLEMTGSVVTGTEGDLYGNLKGNAIYFLLQPTDQEIPSDSKADIRDAKIHGDQGSMENVLLVPVQAVTVDNNILYVTMVREDGSLLKKGFIAGGSNANYYWVLDGLEEGTVILLGR